MRPLSFSLRRITLILLFILIKNPLITGTSADVRVQPDERFSRTILPVEGVAAA
jgi:hypothetical protein